MLNVCIIVLILFIGLYLFCLYPESSRRDQMRAYDGTMFAHRGYHCIEKGIPENSLPAFRAALKKGYGIELDVHLTRDHQVVVFHDDSLKRMCGIGSRPEKMTAAELKKCFLLGTKERIPTLKEVLKLVNGQVPLLIELKLPGRSMELCEQTCRLLNNYHGPYLVQSFNTLGLRWFFKNAPHVLRGQLASNLTKSDRKPHWLFRFLSKHLMLNFWGRPDFISYKLADLPTFNTSVVRKFYNTPFAVWTLKDKASLQEGIKNYNMQIFEITNKFY